MQKAEFRKFLVLLLTCQARPTIGKYRDLTGVEASITFDMADALFSWKAVPPTVERYLEIVERWLNIPKCAHVCRAPGVMRSDSPMSVS